MIGLSPLLNDWLSTDRVTPSNSKLLQDALLLIIDKLVFATGDPSSKQIN